MIKDGNKDHITNDFLPPFVQKANSEAIFSAI
jgi:hypothetical protein